MPAIEIPDPLPPALTIPRTVVEFAIERHLAQFGEDSLVARTWQWILHGGGPGPISHTDWTQFDGNGPPTAATLATESTADPPPLHPRPPWAELNQARFICWWCTAQPGDQVPLRLQPWVTAGHTSAAEQEDGSVTVTIREGLDD